jgi:cobalt-zinc-cadmium efflux system membrane fusion protein
MLSPAVAFFAGGSNEEPPASDETALPTVPAGPWDGYVRLTNRQAQTLGLQVRDVAALTEPLHLDINGTTAYNPNTQAQVRPRFPSVIDHVYVTLGQRVTAGDPLLDLFSADLAAAKSDYEKTQAKWEHDRRELERAERLRKTEPPAISERDYLALVNDEKVSRTEAKVAGDKLQVYGLSLAEIERVPAESGTQKARLTARATIDGLVVKRDAVKGNLYDTDDVLLVIAPVERLWVYGHVYPSDAKYVTPGLKWIVRLQGTQKDIPTTVEAVASDIDPVTRTLRIRGQLPNDDGSVKAESLVGGYLEIPVGPGDTILPREAMVATDGNDYVYVLRSGDPEAATGAESSSAPTGELVFERRVVHVVRERADVVVLAPFQELQRAGGTIEGVGVRPGERVAGRGALILAQLYEEAESSRPQVASPPATTPAESAAGDLTAPRAGVTIR